MTLSSFRSHPCVGHLEDLIRKIYGYLYCFYNFKIQFWAEPPDLSHFNTTNSVTGWSNTVYDTGIEQVPTDAPSPLVGKFIILTHYFDANLMHNVLDGKALVIEV